MQMRVQPRLHEARLKTYQDVITMEDHALFHALPAQRAEFDFLAMSGEEVELNALENRSTGTQEGDLGKMVDTASDSGVRVAYVDITPDDIAPLGPRVVRVLASKLQPISFGVGQVHRGGDRLYHAPVSWGVRPTPLSEGELNSCPHPLA